ncbi:MAG TPA: potassium-transporting ATPase subunit C [Solirubrobacteraceae bacterium]
MSLSRNAITAGLIMIVLTILLGIAYPLVVTGVSQVAFPGNANGQKVYVGGQLIGSKIIGQNFADQVVKNGKPQVDKSGNPVTSPDPRYFQTRPSATVPADNDAATTFSNLGPNNKTTAEEITANIQAYLQLNKPYDPSLTKATVPVDAADSSASGVDPDISQANAWIQAHRVAAVKHIPLPAVMSLIAKYTVGRSLGIFGEPSVDVLELNLALDRMRGGH